MNRRVCGWLAAALVSLAALPGQAQSPAAPTLQPPSNLRADGIPPLPASVAEAVGAYTEFRTAGFAGWHPTRREALLLTRFGDTNQVHEVRMPGGARRQLTFFAERITGASWPRQRGDYFVFTRDRGGDEFWQIFRADVGTGTTVMVSDGGRSQNSLGPWSHKGDRLAFSSTRRNGKDRDVYVMDPRDPATTRRVLELEGGGWAALDWSPDDRQLVVIEYVSINESYLWLVEVATGERRLLTPKGGAVPVAYDGAQFSRDGKGLYVSTDRDAEFLRLAYLDLATGAHRYLTTDLASLKLDRDARGGSSRSRAVAGPHSTGRPTTRSWWSSSTCRSTRATCGWSRSPPASAAC